MQAVFSACAGPVQKLSDFGAQAVQAVFRAYAGL